MKSSIQRAIFGALSLLWCGPTQSEVMPLAVTAPLPTLKATTPSLPSGVASVTRAPKQTLRLDKTDLAAIAKQADVSAFGIDCEPSLAISPSSEAMISVTLRTPCKPSETATFHHGGLTFDLVLPITGEVSFRMPILEKQANLAVTFTDGTHLAGAVEVQEVDDFIRVALQSDGRAQMRLSTDAPSSLKVSRSLLGDGTGNTVQLISHHIDPEQRTGVIRLALKTQVAPSDCDQMREAQVVHTEPDNPPLRYGLSLAAPGCDRVGESLELKNILQDMKLAAQ